MKSKKGKRGYHQVSTNASRKKYNYEISHLRKCEVESCGKLFLWKYDRVLFNKNLHYTCPECRKKKLRQNR